MASDKTQILAKQNVLAPEEKKETKRNLKKILFVANFVLLFTVVGAAGLNQVLISKVSQALGIENNFYKKFLSLKKSNAGVPGVDLELTGDPTGDAIKLVISQGVPEVYGQELGVSFDKVQESMNIMGQYDPTYGAQKIILADDNLKRYVDIGLKIACEYCCGAKSIVFQNGEAACGCAHSQAMRGLAAYLIQNHGSEYSNDEILRELSRWKGMYFPKQMIQKITEQRQSGQYSPDIAALLLGVNLPPISGGQGGNVPLPSNIENLPSMVGGC